MTTTIPATVLPRRAQRKALASRRRRTMDPGSSAAFCRYRWVALAWDVFFCESSAWADWPAGWFRADCRSRQSSDFSGDGGYCRSRKNSWRLVMLAGHGLVAPGTSWYGPVALVADWRNQPGPQLRLMVLPLRVNCTWAVAPGTTSPVARILAG